MPVVTNTLFYVGIISVPGPDLRITDDPTSGTEANLAATNCVGEVFDGSNLTPVDVTLNDLNGTDGTMQNDTAVAPNGDHYSYDVGSGPIDANQATTATMYVTLTLADASTINTVMTLIETGAGDIFLDESYAGIDLDGLDIASIEFTNTYQIYAVRHIIEDGLNGVTICFGRGTLIATPEGEVAVEALKPGDLVSTMGAGPQVVVSAIRDAVPSTGSTAAIHFAPNSIGPGLPRKTMVLSPQHRVLCASKLVKRMFDVDQVLRPAKRFVGRPGILQIETEADVEYAHLHLAEHAILFANGAHAESCLLGEQTIRGLPRLFAQNKVKADREIPCRPPQMPANSASSWNALQGATIRHLTSNSPVTEPPRTADGQPAQAKGLVASL